MMFYVAFRVHRSARQSIWVDQGTASSSLFADHVPAAPDVRNIPAHLDRSAPTSKEFTIVLPVHPHDLGLLRGRLFDILHLASSYGPRSQYEGDLREVLLVCPEDSLAPTKQTVQQALIHYEASNSRDHALEISVHSTSSRSRTVFPDVQLLRIVAGMVNTPWVYFDDIRPMPQMAHFSDSQKPSGPRGFSTTLNDLSLRPHCVSPTLTPTSVSYLVPPLVLPASRLHGVLDTMSPPHESLWQELGESFAKLDDDGVGGLLVGTDDGYCNSYVHSSVEFIDPAPASGSLAINDSKADDIPIPPQQPNLSSVSENPSKPFVVSTRRGIPGAAPADYLHKLELSFLIPDAPPSGTIFAILPTVDDLRASSYLFCRLAEEHHARVAVLLTRYHDSIDVDGALACQLPYRIAGGHDNSSDGIHLWLETLQEGEHRPDVILLSTEVAPAEADEPSDAWVQLLFPDAVVIRLPREDLHVSDWMGSLTLDEWKNWHKPEVEASIITRDRPQSLQRLLTSLGEAHYYGDHLNVRINLEQDADKDTFEVVQRFAESWPHGTVSVQHRVVRGGLLPAVVESWYPRSDDSYGLLLEDDVELSPLFYAWTKMALLRYRYSTPANSTPSSEPTRLFGISLYQQKSNELHADGRRAFDARALFAAHPAVAHASSPYLSQVPCSWGAVYFPRAWRAFHAYLALRLSGRLLPPGEAVAPGLRSNAWARSWKKFFIEMVYLDGGAMLYPNYAGWESLSTNHLERGSHVKVRSREKREMFQVPLMQAEGGGRALLAGMPGEGLPRLADLPVLNLTGSLSSLEEIAEVGRARRGELHACWEEGDSGCHVESPAKANDTSVSKLL
ncbi:hypothetical protein GGG16DRAFT_117925 [Schizophyllum commune]